MTSYLVSVERYGRHLCEITVDAPSEMGACEKAERQAARAQDDTDNLCRYFAYKVRAA